MLRRICLAAEVISVFCVFSPLVAGAQQAPIALPNTVSTAGGGAASALTLGAACSAGSSLTATDTLGDGCLATSAYFNTTASGDLRGGVATDPAGNIYVMDSEDAAVRMINARSGIITLVAGLGTACSSKTDSNGDNCPLADTKFSSTPRGIASDPYGNILVTGYNKPPGQSDMQCRFTPLYQQSRHTSGCGLCILFATDVATTGSAGTSQTGTATGANGGTATPTTCNSSVTELDGARGVAADSYGNMYIADTGGAPLSCGGGACQDYNGVANPLATLQLP